MKLLVFLLLPCLSLSELSPGFSKCKQFFLNYKPPQFTVPSIITVIPIKGTTVQEICQCVRDDNDQQKYIYATLYNTKWRIPIYSAYVFKRSASVRSVGRCDAWYIEPQLDAINDDACMAPKGRRTINNQAVNCDYEDQEPNKPKYDRGHLYPVQHTNNHLAMLATSTLTNAAPQDSDFNRVQWKKHEQDVINDLKDCESEAYVVTGVVPDHSKPKLKNYRTKKAKQVYDRVTVSKYYWRAYCCLQNGVYTGKGYFGPDNNDKVQTLSITALQTQLAKDYNINNIVIFPSLPIPPILPPTTPGKPQLAGSKRPWEDDDDCD